MINYDGLYNKDFFGEKLNANNLYDKKLHFKVIENGTILPHKAVPNISFGVGGIIDAKRNFVKGSVVINGCEGPYTPTEEIICSPATVVYLGMFVGVWGHSLTDHLKHVWFLKSSVYEKYFKNLPMVYIPWQNGVNPNFFELLKMLEIDMSKLYPITKPTQFKCIILPDESFFKEEVDAMPSYTAEYAETIERIRQVAQKNFLSLSQKKFYFFHGKYQIGEERLANYFQTKGYEVIRPEKLPLAEQLNILANCENFASTVGSISHNVIFLRENSNVVLIPRRCAEFSEYQHVLNQLQDLEIFYIDSSLSIFERDAYGPFCYILSENLRKYFGDEITEKFYEEDFVTFLSYAKYSKNRGLNESQRELNYLKNIWSEFIEEIKAREDLMQKFGVFFK